MERKLIVLDAERESPDYHVLKVEREYFEALRDGMKTFEIRKNDRGFKVGDILALHLIDGPQIWIEKQISCILQNCPEFGLSEGFCILGLIDV